MALWSAIYGKIWTLLRREPVPQQPGCRMTKVTISPHSMTKMTNARNTYDKEDKFDHNRLSQNQYTDPEVGLDTVAFEDFLGPSIA